MKDLYLTAELSVKLKKNIENALKWGELIIWIKFRRQKYERVNTYVKPPDSLKVVAAVHMLPDMVLFP